MHTFRDAIDVNYQRMGLTGEELSGVRNLFAKLIPLLIVSGTPRGSALCRPFPGGSTPVAQRVHGADWRQISDNDAQLPHRQIPPGVAQVPAQEHGVL